MIYIKEWFFDKIQSEHRSIHFFYDAVQIVKETEKAYMVCIAYTTRDGEYESFRNVWVPKSCTLTKYEYEKELAEEKKRFEDGKAAYEKMIAWAKGNGVKGVRVGLRKETILKKINEAGLCYNF